MTGILLLVLALLWLAFVVWIAVFISGRVQKRWALPIASAIGLLMLVAPLGDEIIGMWQFGMLCETHAVQHVDSAARGRRVVFAARSEDTYAQGTTVRIRIDPWVYRDISDGKVLVSYHTLQAEGGWLIRLLGISETNSPILFNRSCRPKEERRFISDYDITVVN